MKNKKKAKAKTAKSVPVKKTPKTALKLLKKASPSSKQTVLPPYNHLKLEPKWQKFWAANPKLSQAVDNDAKRQKLYMLVEFPFPSGAGLHAGHVRSYVALDIIARMNRMQGKNVLYPMGWDAFGLPAENYAIKTGVLPQVSTAANIKNFKKQMQELALSFDWSREVNTTDPKYFKWTQWIFLQFLKAGLAYRDKISINWCPKDKIGLANEEVVNGCCERCGTKVEKREKEQWMLAITKYADRLDKDLDTVDYPDRVKIQQRNWIGKSEGVKLRNKVEGNDDIWFEMYDSIPQTHAAQSFVVIAPDHKLLPQLVESMPNKSEILKTAAEIVDQREAGAFETIKDMRGIFTGRYVEYAPTNSKLPIWVASFVVADYGTGIVGCSAHDERDFLFAKKYNIPLKAVLLPPNDPERAERVKKFEEFYREPDGILQVPAQFKGRRWDEVREDIINYLVKNGWATRSTNYKLRDWVFSRQRYWGEPIPVVHCEKCGIVPLPESALPLTLPKVKKYVPTDTGESPLASIDSWVNTKCPKCKGKAKRETDTMPNWAGSSWYYLRYADPKNAKAFADPKKLKYWTPVDWYNGGMEHTTLHLLYSRFWHKFLYDKGFVPTIEPYAKRTSHGLIMADDGTKMSKSKGNVINPDDIIKTYGADTLRLFEMFIGPFEQAVAWNSDGLIGPRRFIERVYKLAQKVNKNVGKNVEKGVVKKGKASAGVTNYNVTLGSVTPSTETTSLLHKTIQKVTADIQNLNMNTAVSSLMILSNQFEKEMAQQPGAMIPRADFEMFLAMLAPFVPHVAEEMNAIIGNKKSVSLLPWPKADASLIVEEAATVVIQINGKVRAMLPASIEDSKNESVMTKAALDMPAIQERLAGLTIRKTIFVPGKIVNFVAN